MNRESLNYLIKTLLFVSLLGSWVTVSAEVPELFSTNKTLELSMVINFDSLCRPREVENCDYSPITLKYSDGAGNIQSLPAEVKIRGGWRTFRKNCL